MNAIPPVVLGPFSGALGMVGNVSFEFGKFGTQSNRVEDHHNEPLCPGDELQVLCEDGTTVSGRVREVIGLPSGLDIIWFNLPIVLEGNLSSAARGLAFHEEVARIGIYHKGNLVPHPDAMYRSLATFKFCVGVHTGPMVASTLTLARKRKQKNPNE